jgi:hypothetical protein
MVVKQWTPSQTTTSDLSLYQKKIIERISFCNIIQTLVEQLLFNMNYFSNNKKIK